MVKTLVVIAHPELDSSMSQQFLIESGMHWSNVDYLDLTDLYSLEDMVITDERNRLIKYDRVFFQFPLYWYQAPAVLKQWLDDILPLNFEDTELMHALSGKDFGLIVTIGRKEEHFQSGGQEQRTLSEMLSPFEMLARSLGWNFLPIFNIHQFEFMSEEEKMTLMMRYACYIETGNKTSESLYHQYIIKKLQTIDDASMTLDAENKMVFHLFVETLQEQSEEFNELMTITEKW
ncbi:NAD(P)H-dependent oxidoreductase [Aerococcaceae bacterium DSM 111020]|nr:NAD(P)H-dependent oxidoreductase [Aerococcaceae bacterium DSM 111020]